MAITSLIGVQTAPTVLFRPVSSPGNATFAGELRNTGSLNFGIFPAQTSGLNTYLSTINLQTNRSSGSFFIFDVIWAIVIPSSTALQPLSTPDIGNRDINGTNRGDGVYLALANYGVNSSAVGTGTITYTSSDGNTNRTTIIPFGNWQSGSTNIVRISNGDVGVRSVQSIQYSVLTGQTYILFAFRPIAVVSNSSIRDGSAVTDAINLGLPQIYTGSNIVLFYTLTSNLFGELKFIYG